MCLTCWMCFPTVQRCHSDVRRIDTIILSDINVIQTPLFPQQYLYPRSCCACCSCGSCLGGCLPAGNASLSITRATIHHSHRPGPRLPAHPPRACSSDHVRHRRTRSGFTGGIGQRLRAGWCDACEFGLGRGLLRGLCLVLVLFMFFFFFFFLETSDVA
jgi:hypothetical protein